MKKTEFKKFIRDGIKERIIVEVKEGKIMIATGFMMLEFKKHSKYAEIASEIFLSNFDKGFTVRQNKVTNEEISISAIVDGYELQPMDMLPFIYVNDKEMRMFEHDGKYAFADVELLKVFDLNEMKWYYNAKNPDNGLIKGVSEEITCYICPVRISKFEYKILK